MPAGSTLRLSTSMSVMMPTCPTRVTAMPTTVTHAPIRSSRPVCALQGVESHDAGEAERVRGDEQDIEVACRLRPEK
jgi:hypothetical protein